MRMRVTKENGLVYETSSTHREVVDEFDHVSPVSDDEWVEAGHERLLGLKLHQVGQVLHSLGHQLEGPQ